MKIYVLYLANVHTGVDRTVPVAISENKEKLEKWEKEQRAEAKYNSDDEHMDVYGNTHGYELVYKKGSHIQWYNPPEMGFGGFRVHEIEVDNIKDIQDLPMSALILDE